MSAQSAGRAKGIVRLISRGKRRANSLGAAGLRTKGAPAVRRRTVLPCTCVVTAGTYRSLHDYLEHRYADTVVLSLRQIEDLLGFALPASARTDPAWWTTTAEESGAADHSQAWHLAHRTARPNLPAGNVVFERIP
jgi:hypothetical protein